MVPRSEAKGYTAAKHVVGLRVRYHTQTSGLQIPSPKINHITARNSSRNSGVIGKAKRLTSNIGNGS